MRRLTFMWLISAACTNASSVTTDAAKDGVTTQQTDAATPATCGVRTGQRGKTNRTVHAAGLDRTYIVYLPANVDPNEHIPLVYVHHGYTMSAQAMFDITHYAQLADSEHIAVAFPDGQGGPNTLGAPWNVGTNICHGGASEPPNAAGDDFAMIDAIKADITLDQCIDTAHVFVTGFSMGGYFSHHAGCMRDDIRAVAPHSGGTHPLDTCATGHKPIIIFHGKSDTIVPDGCDDPNVSTPNGATPSATAWARKNGCANTTTTVSVRFPEWDTAGQVARARARLHARRMRTRPRSSGRSSSNTPGRTTRVLSSLPDLCEARKGENDFRRFARADARAVVLALA
jgi:poly(3-hydroxybutyrate) depolymerase